MRSGSRSVLRCRTVLSLRLSLRLGQLACRRADRRHRIRLLLGDDPQWLSNGHLVGGKSLYQTMGLTIVKVRDFNICRDGMPVAPALLVTGPLLW
jgi:hypothetical protein